ncbi:small ribosomal subunit protein uS3m [Vanacampus margaritifer]
MAASLSSTGCRLFLAAASKSNPAGSRALHVTAVCCKNRAARQRVGTGDRPLTYEQALKPHHIGHHKGWLSQHTSNLRGEDGAAARAVEDAFIRRLIFGTFHGCLADELVIKRRGNVLTVCALVLQKLPPHKIYFLIGYAESLLSHFYKCPVKMDVQTLQDKQVYKYL